MAKKEKHEQKAAASPPEDPALRDSGREGRREWLRILPIVGVFLLIGGFAWAIRERYFDPAAIALCGLGFLLFLTAFIRAEAANLKHYVLAGLSAFFVLGICVGVYIFAMRHNPRIDLTQQNIHTLSEATQSYLQLLRKDVEIVVFDVTREPYRLLNLYDAASPHVEWTLHDPRAEPEFTRQFAPTVTDGLIFIRHGEKTKRISVSELDEAAMTSAIIEVTREKRIKVYFMTGHGELEFDPEQPDPRNQDAQQAPPSLYAFREFLSSRAMEVEELDLLSRGFIPDDATLVVIAGPRFDLEEVEVRQLERYLSEGGSLLVLFDLPKLNISVSFTQMAQLLRGYGIDDDEQVIVDLRGQRVHNSPFIVPLANYNAEHPISEPMIENAEVIYVPLVRALGRVPQLPPATQVTPIVMSSEESWVEPFVRLFVAQSEPQLTPPPRDNWSPRPIGWAAEQIHDGGETRTRIVAYGSSDLVRDGYINVQNTAAYLMLNTVNWLTEQEDRVQVPRRVIAGTPLMLTNAELQLILIIVAIAFPMAILAGGVTYAAVIRRT